MADLRITDLPLLAGADLDSADLVAVADLSASETKKLAAGDLITDGVTRLLSNGTLPGAKLVAGSISESQLASDSVTTSKVVDNAITYAKLQNVSDTDLLLGRSSAGAGSVEEIVCTSAGRALLADASASAQRTTLGLGDLATATGTWTDGSSFSGTSSGTNTGDQTITLTGDVTGSGTGSFATSISAGVVGTTQLSDEAVTYEKIQSVNNSDRLLGRVSAGSGVIEEIVCTSAGRALLDDVSAAAQRTTLGLGDLATKSTVGAADLAADSVGTAALQSGAVTTAKIGSGQITNSLITDGAITNSKITDATITYAKLNLADGSVPASKISGLTGGQLAPNSVGATELADNAVDTAALQNSAVTDAKVASGISGSKISNNSLNGTALVGNSVTGDKIASSAVDRGLDITGSAIGHTNSIVAGTANGITFDSQGHITGTSQLSSGDIPAASTTTVGGVSIPASSGLSVSGAGVVSHTDTTTGATISGITFNNTGHITGAVALTGSDLPTATTTTIGGVAVPGTVITVDGSGNLYHATSGAAAGTYTKVTINAEGHVTLGQQLTANDIPNLDASKIVSGQLNGAFLAPNSVTAAHLADYGVAVVSETAPIPEFAGQWWINPSDRSAYVWVGAVSPTLNGSWLLIGYGSATQLNLRFGGTYNASTNTVVSVNTYGSEAGLVPGQALSAPNNQNNGIYLVVTTTGTGTTPAPTSTLAVGDWVLSQGTGANWTKIAVVSGASGTYNDYDILCDGTYFTPDMTGVSDVRDALDLLWGRVQVATTSTLGVVKESTEIVVDNTTGEMTVGIVDDGTY